MDRQTALPAWRRRRIIRRALLLLAVVGAAAWGFHVWETRVKDRMFIKNFGVVKEGEIYRSGALTPESMRIARRSHGVRTIIDFGSARTGSDEEAALRQTAATLGVERHVYRLKGDATGNPNNYVQALRMMSDPANQPVLVHCAAGAQRTGCATLLYRWIEEGKPIDEAYPELFRYGHTPRKDWELLAYLAEHGAEIRKAYLEGGWIPGFDIPVDEASVSAAPQGSALETETAATPDD